MKYIKLFEDYESFAKQHAKKEIREMHIKCEKTLKKLSKLYSIAKD